MLNKKAQLSIFIVIGVIMIVVSLFLFFNNEFEIFQSSDTKMKNQVTDIVEGCLFEFAENGVFLLGFQGGYIDLPFEQQVDSSRHIDLGLKIANWDSELGEIPTIDSMEQELDNFITEESLSCITSNLRALSEFMDVESEDIIDVKVEINKENVLVTANLPVKYSERNSEEISTIENFAVQINPVRLGDMYDLALEIYNLEASTLFIEDLVLDQIYSSSDYSDEISMPSEGMQFSCGSRVWTIPQLKENLANLNNNNFKYLYFQGTYPIDEIMDINLGEESVLRQYFEKNYFFSLDDQRESFSNYKVDVVMPSTEITGNEGLFQSYPYRTFEVRPSSGQIVKPIEAEVDAGIKIPIPCIQVYHHLYDLDYDLVVQLRDFSSDGQNYIFQFPLRVEISSNTPKSPQFTPIQVELSTANNEVFCEDSNKVYPLRVFAKDNDNNYLSDVEVSYECVALSCDIGKTSKPFFNGIERVNADPYLEEMFPYCDGGKLVVKKDGYHEAKLQITTDESLLGREIIASHDLEMIPLKEFSLELGSFLVVNREDSLGKRIRTEEDGSIYVNIKNEELDFETQAIWPNDGEIFNKLELLDQEGVSYEVDVYYADSDYNLKGLLDIEDWTPSVRFGNNIQFVIPGTKDIIGPDDYTEFYEYALRVQDSSQYGVKIN